MVKTLKDILKYGLIYLTIVKHNLERGRLGQLLDKTFTQHDHVKYTPHLCDVVKGSWKDPSPIPCTAHLHHLRFQLAAHNATLHTVLPARVL